MFKIIIYVLKNDFKIFTFDTVIKSKQSLQYTFIKQLIFKCD
jgi:hypothetical protein